MAGGAVLPNKAEAAPHYSHHRESSYRESHYNGHRGYRLVRVWVRGHYSWRYGHRHWIPGHYEWRRIYYWR